MDYSSAYSWIPGRVHVEGLKIRGSDWNIQWVLGIDKCDFNFSPLETSFIRLSRLARTRRRFDFFAFACGSRARRQEHTAALPPVPGFGRFSASPKPRGPTTRPPTKPPSTTSGQSRLDDVDARDVREIWTDTIRYSGGNMRVRGRWIFPADAMARYRTGRGRQQHARHLVWSSRARAPRSKGRWAQ